MTGRLSPAGGGGVAGGGKIAHCKQTHKSLKAIFRTIANREVNFYSFIICFIFHVIIFYMFFVDVHPKKPSFKSHER